MAIYRLLQEAAFDQEQIDVMIAAYEAALKLLHLVDRHDPVTELLARKIIEVTQNGERRPTHICARAIKELGVPLPE